MQVPRAPTGGIVALRCGIVLRCPQTLGFLAIPSAESFLFSSKRVFGVEDSLTLKQPESMFHEHLHSLCEVRKNRYGVAGVLVQATTGQQQSSADDRRFPDNSPDINWF